MNFLPSFVAWPFAVAGLVAAAGPIIIHLLNRRRYRVVSWAAMDFLRQALQRNRRILQLRDLLLLLIRSLAVLLVGLALAQPFLSRSQEIYDGTKPLHCVLLIDNSLSMGFESLEGTLLDQARQRARQLVDRLPADSRISVIPAAGSRGGHSLDAYTKKDALAALERIELVDRSTSVQQAVNEARRAMETGPNLSKRVMFFSDQQASNWTDLAIGELAEMPSLQVVEVDGAGRQNTWVSGLRVQDGVADVETPATFLVELRHQGPDARENLQVTLAVDGVEVGSKTVTLEPGSGAREVAFEYAFHAYQPVPGQALAVPVRASITPDRLPADDHRSLVVPVVAALPVVFVDQYGADEENTIKNRVGETRPLRRLLAPVSSRATAARQLIQLRHVTLDQLDREMLEDARLVVLAGVADPRDSVRLLREYVQQGGQLLIAAGGRYNPAMNSGFDPRLWTSAAWLDGAGILPAPLLPEVLGVSPEQAGADLRSYFLSFDSLAAHDYFQLAGASEDQLRTLYAEPFFFQAVRADLSPENLQTLHQTELQRLDQQLSQLQRGAGQPDASAEQPVAAGDSATDVGAARPPGPHWLLWGQSGDPLAGIDPPAEPADRQQLLAGMASQSQPRVLARFDDPSATPYLIERRIGHGSVLFAASGLLPEWNTLATTNAVLVFDRILRSMIRTTLPSRNFATADRIALPLPTADRDVRPVLLRPGDGEPPEQLDVGFVGREQLGVSIEQPLTRGVYRITAEKASPAADAAPETAWELLLAVNGEAAESDLQSLTREEFEQRVALTNLQWVGPGEQISLAGSQVRGQHSWWWLILVVLGLLILEVLVLAMNPGPSSVQVAVT